MRSLLNTVFAILIVCAFSSCTFTPIPVETESKTLDVNNPSIPTKKNKNISELVHVEAPRFFHRDGNVAAIGVLHRVDPDTGIDLGPTVTAFETEERKKGDQVSRDGEFQIYEVRPHPLAPEDSSYDQMKVLINDKWAWISRIQFRSINLIEGTTSGLAKLGQGGSKEVQKKKSTTEYKPKVRPAKLSATQCGTLLGTLVHRGHISYTEMERIIYGISNHLDHLSRVNSATLYRYIKMRTDTVSIYEFNNLVGSAGY